MSEGNGFNAFENFGESWFKTWEKGYSEGMEQLLRNQANLKAMGTALSQWTQLMGAWNTACEQTLKTFRLPTRGDLEQVMNTQHRTDLTLADLGESLERVNHRLSGIEARLESLAATPATPATPAKPKRSKTSKTSKTSKKVST